MFGWQMSLYLGLEGTGLGLFGAEGKFGLNNEKHWMDVEYSHVDMENGKIKANP